MRQLPNVLTLMRLLLVLPIAWLLLAERYGVALLLFAVAGISDVLDGYLARRFGWLTRLGAMLDPLADKLLLVSSYLCLSLTQVLPWWLTLMVCVRDVLIVLGAGLFRWLNGAIEFTPTWLGKCSTVMQIVLVIAVLLAMSVLEAFNLFLPWLIGVVAVLAIASVGHYIWRWTRLYLQRGY